VDKLRGMNEVRNSEGGSATKRMRERESEGWWETWEETSGERMAGDGDEQEVEGERCER
jgi:hypothetical protein